MKPDVPEDLIYASFFFIDIVGLSNPILSTETQRTKIKRLNQIIYDCKIFQENWNDDLLMLPTGDGMLIGFVNGLEQPLKLAIEFHKKLQEYNKKVTEAEKIETRIGCHIGHVFVVKDVLGNMNLWGPGAILARRIMDMGDANHILVSSDLTNDLIEISKDYEENLHPLHNFGIKHGENLLVYSAFGDGYGNSTLPKEKIKIKTHELDGEKNTKCDKITFNIFLKEQSTSASFERYYYFSNTSSEPIYEIPAGIVTNYEEEFQDLKIKAFDENNTELEISKILASTPFSKKIVVKLTKPIFLGDSKRMLKIIYEANLFRKNFENFFLIDTAKFELNLSCYSNIKIIPNLFYFDNKMGSKNLIEISSRTTKGLTINFNWEKDHGINVKDMILLEW